MSVTVLAVFGAMAAVAALALVGAAMARRDDEGSAWSRREDQAMLPLGDPRNDDGDDDGLF